MDLQENKSGTKPGKRDERAPPKGLPRRSQIAILLTFLVVAGAAIVIGVPGMHGLIGLNPDEKPAEEPAPASDGKTVTLTDKQWATVKIAQAEQRVFQNAAETDGKIAIDDDIVTPVFSPYTGRVTRLFARAGDTVAAGDPLFAIQATELAQAQNDLISAAAALRTAKAQLQLATTNEKRQHDLYLARGAALKDWQQAQLDLATAQGGLDSAAIALRAVRNRLAILGKSDAEIDVMENASDIVHLNAEAVVSAPISGTVVQRQIGLGQNIISASSGAQNPVFQIGDTAKVWLIANVREGDAPLMHIGDPVEVSVLAFPGRVFHARLTYVASSIDPNTHRLPVRAEVENPTGELKPEMFATFRIVTGGQATETAVPQDAVVFEGDTAHVWVANPAAKTLEIRQVAVGMTRDGLIEVLKGLKPGERIVTSGSVFIDRAAAGD